MLEANGLPYIGTQYVALFGQIDPLPAPLSASAVVMASPEGGASASPQGDAIEVSWTGVSGAAGYLVVAHARAVLSHTKY
jgi:hypothetical protein